LPAKATEKDIGCTALPGEKVILDMVSDWQIELPQLLLYI
jgi:hypothetical protein